MHGEDSANISVPLVALIRKSVCHASHLRAILTLTHGRVYKLLVVVVQRTWLQGASLLVHTRAYWLVQELVCRCNECAFVLWDTTSASTLVIIRASKHLLCCHPSIFLFLLE